MPEGDGAAGPEPGIPGVAAGRWLDARARPAALLAVLSGLWVASMYTCLATRTAQPPYPPTDPVDRWLPVAEALTFLSREE